MAFFHFYISHNFRMNWARKLGQKLSWSSFLADLEYHNDNEVWIFGIRNSIEFRIMEKWIRKSNFSRKYFQYNRISGIFGLALTTMLLHDDIASELIDKIAHDCQLYQRWHSLDWFPVSACLPSRKAWTPDWTTMLD